MPRHEEYEELCTLAMVGEASPDELYSLRAHLRECAECRREYREFTQLVLPQLWAMDDSAVPDDTRESTADTTQLRASFLARAQAEGISFSPETLRVSAEPLPAREPIVLRKQPRWHVVAAVAMAACLMLAAIMTGRFAGRSNQSPTRQATGATQVPVAAPAAPVVAAPPKQDLAAAELVKLESRQQELQHTLDDLQSQLADVDADRAALKKQLEEKSDELAQLQTSANASQQTVASLRTQVTALQTRADSSEATFVADQAKIQELTAQASVQNQTADREHQMLAAGKDMRDMMAARNLHIVDVFDTDGGGKTRSAFGRIFFSEDRQLVFYAYDLNEKRLEDARYSYRIWGQKEGQPQTARSLGIFYSDSKTERRWVFKYDDPKVLSQIDSVFVTLEPSNADPEHPRGQKLMYAYLRGQANHP